MASRIVRAASSFIEHGAFTYSASLAFYALLALPGMVLASTAIAGSVLGRELVQQQFLDNVEDLAGRDAAETARGISEQLADSEAGRLATIAGLAVLLFAATGFFVQLQEALNVVWEVKPSPFSNLWQLIKSRLLSFCLVLAMGVLLLLYLGAGVAFEAFEEMLGTLLPVPYWSVRVLDSLSLFVAVLAFFTVLYRILPDTSIAWSEAFRGALFSSFFFLGGRYLITLWLSQDGVASAYSAGGSVVVLVLWVYYSSLLLLFGAELSRIAAEQRSTG